MVLACCKYIYWLYDFKNTSHNLYEILWSHVAHEQNCPGGGYSVEFCTGVLGPKPKSGPNRIENFAKKGGKKIEFCRYFGSKYGSKYSFWQKLGAKTWVLLKQGGKKIELGWKWGAKRSSQPQKRGAKGPSIPVLRHIGSTPPGM